jgi:DNA-directed RNA polymerase specialized sigma24 family protein
MSTVLTDVNAIQKLRAALQAQNQRAIDQAAAPIIEALHQDLCAFGNRLVRGTPRALGIDGDDLIQEAWVRVLKYLTTPSGLRVTTLEDLTKLLYRTAKNLFLDRLDSAATRGELELDAPTLSRSTESASSSFADYLPSPKSESELGQGLFFAMDSAFLLLVTKIFSGDGVLREYCSEKPRRRAKHYQACILFAVAEHYKNEIIADGDRVTDREVLRLFDRQVALLGISEPDWAAVSEIAGQKDVTDETLLSTINQRLDTAIKGRDALNTLRHELRILV